MDSYNEQCSCQQDKWYRFKGYRGVFTNRSIDPSEDTVSPCLLEETVHISELLR